MHIPIPIYTNIPEVCESDRADGAGQSLLSLNDGLQQCPHDEFVRLKK